MSNCVVISGASAKSESITKMLPEKPVLSDDEITVLKYTSSLKSSYAGIKNYRFHEAHRNTGISLDNWNTTKQALIDKKLLRKNGSITADGRNAI